VPIAINIPPLVTRTWLLASDKPSSPIAATVRRAAVGVD